MSPSLSKTRVASLAVFAVLLVSANVALAEEGSSGPLQRLRAALPMQPQREAVKEFRQEAAEVRGEIREDRREFREGVASTSASMRTETRSALKNASTSEERREIREDAREDRREFREDVASTSASMRSENKEKREDLREKARELVVGRLKTVAQRFSGAIERFDQIKARIDSRIEKLAASGIDTSIAKTASDNAGRTIQAAKDAVSAARSTLDSATASENPKEQMESVKTAIQNATKAIKAANDSLKEAIRALVSIAPKNQSNDSSTNE